VGGEFLHGTDHLLTSFAKYTSPSPSSVPTDTEGHISETYRDMERILHGVSCMEYLAWSAASSWSSRPAYFCSVYVTYRPPTYARGAADCHSHWHHPCEGNQIVPKSEEAVHREMQMRVVLVEEWHREMQMRVANGCSSGIMRPTIQGTTYAIVCAASDSVPNCPAMKHKISQYHHSDMLSIPGKPCS
jgi:hypothetical protein